MNIIFLDIDGVMNHRSYMVKSKNHMLHEFCPQATKNLKRIIEECNAKIVVSSSWREEYSAEEMASWLFSYYDLDSFIIGVTPHLPEEIRGNEISKYINEAEHEISNFVILDDFKDMGDLLPYLVQTDIKWGLTDKETNQAIALLNKQNK